MSKQHSVTKISHGFEHVSLKAYLIGFITCILITVGAFTLVGKQLLTGQSLIIAILSLALIQLLVQLKCFLHLSTKSKARWNLITLIFTVIILLIIVLGSLWIMHSLNDKMMMR